MSSGTLDRQRIRELFDLRTDVYASRGGGFAEDPYPRFHELRGLGPVVEGTVHDLIGYQGPELLFQGLPFANRRHFSVFDYDTCLTAFRDTETFTSRNTPPVDGDDPIPNASILFMDGREHRRYRALVQPSFVPNRAQWWLSQWITSTVHELIDNFAADGRSDLNTDFCAPIPLLTITGSFGVTVEDALDIRQAVTSDGTGSETIFRILSPVIGARRSDPTDDLISVLVQAEISDDDGESHRLNDAEVLGFAFLLLAAGSGTTWKQMGITLSVLLHHPDVLAAVRDDRTLIKAAVEESLRWMPTDTTFSRFVAKDVDLAGVRVPAGSVLHLCLAAGNRDPKRWDAPDEYSPARRLLPHLGFGGGAHICLGMHVAKAEISAGLDALLDRLANLRLDPDAEPVKVTGVYERGPTAVPVVFDPA